MKLPILPLRDVALFPRATLPVKVGRRSSLQAVRSLREGELIAAVMQRDAGVERPALADLHAIGTTGRLLSMNEIPTGAHEPPIFFLEGVQRVRLIDEVDREPFLLARVEMVEDIYPSERDVEFAALERNVRELVAEVIRDSPNLPDEVLPILDKIGDPALLTDLLASSLPSLDPEERQDLLATPEVRIRLERLGESLAEVRQEQQIRNKIRNDVQDSLAERQREVLLREELKVIQKELGELDDGERDVQELEQSIDRAGLPAPARQEAGRELRRLRGLPAASPEYSMARGYLDWLASLPWSRSSAGEVDLARAQRILDRDHFDLEQVKERILEFLAVFQLRRTPRAPLLCFVGPPGVGKTSLGRSIAEATGREFTRLSLGGTGDEAEIRGHRRTYVGALPGQIIQNLRRVGTNDPVFMLDEVDKLGRDFRGDPASALLEVLDPEQNATFRDRYLDVPFDLSRVLFITTANILDPIPPALRDRMEVIELPGYVDEEKRVIARRYLVPRQTEQHGLLLGGDIAFDDSGIDEIVRGYTREAGVRLLEQKIAAVCRKRARQILSHDRAPGRLVVDAGEVRRLLGPVRYQMESELEERTRLPGVAVALAWTSGGGEILFVEATRMERDKGEFTVTGHVRKVMEESARAALSWVRANGERYGIPPELFRASDLHLHIPSGAAPKDGPSAGLVMVMAIMSLLSRIPVKPRLALTGEITLSGQVLAVGGIKGKVLAARRSGVREIVLPRDNEPHVLDEIPAHLRAGISFHYVRTVDEAIRRAFDDAPVQLPRGADDRLDLLL